MDELKTFLHAPLVVSTIHGVLWVCVGLPLVFLLAGLAKRKVSKKISPHAGLVISKLIAYVGSILVGVSVLLSFHFNLSAVLGTAGIASVAIGFASQKSLSNLISGLFLIWEKPFQVGDLVQINKADTTGYILSIDLLSVKLRTRDNLFVRIPNEVLVESDFINLSRFPIRRYKLPIGVAYGSDLRKVEQVLIEVGYSNPCCLDEPEPCIYFDKLGPSSIDFLLCVWVEQSRFTEVQNTLARDVLERFAKEGIEVPFNRQDVAFRKGEPIEVKVLQ